MSDAYNKAIAVIIEYDDTPSGTYANSGDMASDMAHDILLAIGYDDLLAACKKLVDEAERVRIAEISEGIILPRLQRAADEAKAAIALAEGTP